MLSPKEVMEKYPEGVDEFFRVTFALSNEEMAALEHVSPMTQELFETCYEKLMAADAIRTCIKLMTEYPDFTNVMVQNIMSELDLTEEDFKPLSVEESKKGLEDLRRRLDANKI